MSLSSTLGTFWKSFFYFYFNDQLGEKRKYIIKPLVIIFETNTTRTVTVTSVNYINMKHTSKAFIYVS